MVQLKSGDGAPSCQQLSVAVSTGGGGEAKAARHRCRAHRFRVYSPWRRDVQREQSATRSPGNRFSGMPIEEPAQSVPADQRRRCSSIALLARWLQMPPALSCSVPTSRSEGLVARNLFAWTLASRRAGPWERSVLVSTTLAPNRGGVVLHATGVSTRCVPPGAPRPRDRR